MEGLFWLTVGLAAVVFGAGRLVDGASGLARRLGISDLAVGLTVVAFGTSLPELAVNVFASVENSPAIAIGNITGSNIANIFLILGISSLIFPLQTGRGTTWREIPFALLAASLLAALTADRFFDGSAAGSLSRTDGLAFLGFFIVFLYYVAGIAKDTPGIADSVRKDILSTSRCTVFIIVGLVLLIVGGKLVVSGAVRIAQAAGLSESFIAVTLVAVGTSIPELATSVAAAFKKNPDIAVGNIVGSNIFNIFFILGISSLIRPIPVPQELYISIYAGIIAAAVLFICMFTGRRHRIDRWEGAAMLGLYVLYLVFQA